MPTVFAGPTGQKLHRFAKPSGVAKEPGGRTSSDVFASWMRRSASQISPGSCAKRKCSVPVPSTSPGRNSNVWDVHCGFRGDRPAIHGAKEEPRGNRLPFDVDLGPAARLLDADGDGIRRGRGQEGSRSSGAHCIVNVLLVAAWFACSIACEVVPMAIGGAGTGTLWLGNRSHASVEG